ncbi:hypothetical protein V491_04779, partial [Pseudogymnoascus sp. VKM F-3775]
AGNPIPPEDQDPIPDPEAGSSSGSEPEPSFGPEPGFELELEPGSQLAQQLQHELEYGGGNGTENKLPALSGVARLGYNEIGDQYLAGLWRDKLEEQLCWSRLPRRVHYPRATRPRPAWRAPTWSWASIDGEVYWHTLQEGILETTYVQILDANTTKYGYDLFGQVTSGFIRLACSTIAAGHLVHHNESNNPEPKDNAIIELSVGDTKLSFSVQMDCQDESDRLPATGLAIYRLSIRGIMLQATGVAKGECSRIGSFTFTKDGHSSFGYGAEEETYEGFLRVLKEHGKATAKAACSEVISNRKHIDKRYVITLV